MPRIRSIKPEFWSHPLMAKQDDATRLLAIALLNFADDEGYFHAEPNLVRGFCRPFDDNSEIARRGLDDLSKIGYISICENKEYGIIGFIEKFLDHQRIDRPTPSKLKSYFSSTNARRVLDEGSLLEGKGRERKGKEDSTESVGENADSLHAQIISAHTKWYLEKVGEAYPFQKGLDGKAVKEIKSYLSSSINKKTGHSPSEHEVVCAWKFILDSHSRWEPFLQKQYKLNQIGSNLANIMATIKQKKQANVVPS